MNRLNLLRCWPFVLCCLALSGCASQPARQLAHFPTATELATPKEQLPSYEQARTDFQRVAAGQRPQFASQNNALRDGGTTFYRGHGYALTVWHRLSTEDGHTSYVYAGPEIRFDRLLSPAGSVSYSAATTRKHHPGRLTTRSSEPPLRSGR